MTHTLKELADIGAAAAFASDTKHKLLSVSKQAQSWVADEPARQAFAQAVRDAVLAARLGLNLEGKLPNYTDDLNAMHEVEKVLTKEQRREYVRTLFQTTNTDWESHCATAAQRAEAFLKTLELWEETK